MYGGTLFTETVVLHVPGGPTGEYDDLGNEIIAPDRDVETPAWYEQRTSTEALDAREQRVWGFWLYVPLDAPLDDGVDVTLPIDGKRYRVVGEPGRQPGGFIVDGYILAAIERHAG